MSKFIVSIIISLLFTLAIQANSLELGQRFPLEKLKQTAVAADNTIVVFIPSLTDDCEYASMLTQSFYFYFDQKLAFEKLRKTPTVNVAFVVNDKINAAKSTQNILGKMNVIYDENGKLFDEFGISKPVSKNADSSILLLDSSEKIRLIDKSYRSQGEHLKPLENKLKELNEIGLNVSPKSNFKELKVGDNAHDFRINATQKLSDLRGNVVLISFYPAAFSGTLPRPIDWSILSASNPSKLSGLDLMSCSFQIGKLDLKLPTENAKRILISSSTESILSNWQKALNTQNIIYANDADYSISLKYGSYNQNGYNNRVSVIINRKGKIAYIDKSFEAEDEKVLNEKLDELLKKK